MDAQLTRLNPLLLTRLFNQFFCQCSQLPGSHHPAHDVSAEDIEDDIEVIISPLCRPLEFGNIPGPNLVWPFCKQFWFGVYGMPKLVPSFLYFLMCFQNPVHRPHGTEITAAIQKGGVNLLWRFVNKLFIMQNIKNILLVIERQG